MTYVIEKRPKTKIASSASGNYVSVAFYVDKHGRATIACSRPVSIQLSSLGWTLPVQFFFAFVVFGWTQWKRKSADDRFMYCLRSTGHRRKHSPIRLVFDVHRLLFRYHNYVAHVEFNYLSDCNRKFVRLRNPFSIGRSLIMRLVGIA